MKGREQVAYKLVVDEERKTFDVEIVRGQAAIEAEPSKGTMRGATAECLYCGTPTERERIAQQGRKGQIGQRLIAVILAHQDETGRDFRAATEADQQAYAIAKQKLIVAEEQGYDYWGFDRLLAVVPDEPTPNERSRATAIRSYGVEQWSHLFNSRQLLSALVLGQQIRSVREILARDDVEYAKAVALYLSSILVKVIMYNSIRLFQ